MYSVVTERFLKGNAVIVADKGLMSFGYPALTFKVESDNESFHRMIGDSNETVLSLKDSTLKMTIAIPTERDIAWEDELKKISIEEPITMADRTVYRVILRVTITPLGPSHSQVSDR